MSIDPARRTLVLTLARVAHLPRLGERFVRWTVGIRWAILAGSCLMAGCGGPPPADAIMAPAAATPPPTAVDVAQNRTTPDSGQSDKTSLVPAESTPATSSAVPVGKAPVPVGKKPAPGSKTAIKPGAQQTISNSLELNR